MGQRAFGTGSDAGDQSVAHTGRRMKISRLDWTVYDRRRDKSDGKPKLFVVLRIVADNGAEGYCELPGWHETIAQSAHQQAATSLLLGNNPLEREANWSLLRENDVSLDVISMVDIALWDFFGRIKGKPVHALLGTRRDKVRAYVSSPFNVGGGKPEAYADQALEVVGRGFHGYKVHPTHNDKWRPEEAAGEVETDIGIYRAVREAIGDAPDFALVSDNYHTYSHAESLRVGRVLEELDYRWYESPMFERDRDMPHYVNLCRELEIPICGPETNDGAHMSRLRWMEAGACDMCRIDFYYGGLTSCWIVTQACQKAGMALDLHTGNYSHLQVMGSAAAEAIPYFEHYATSPCVEFKDGCAVIPQTPGMGLELDWDYIQAHRLS